MNLPPQHPEIAGPVHREDGEHYINMVRDLQLTPDQKSLLNLGPNLVLRTAHNQKHIQQAVHHAAAKLISRLEYDAQCPPVEETVVAPSKKRLRTSRHSDVSCGATVIPQAHTEVAREAHRRLSQRLQTSLDRMRPARDPRKPQSHTHLIAQLLRLNDVTIGVADKHRILVLMPTSWVHSQMHKHLDDLTTYKPLEDDGRRELEELRSNIRSLVSAKDAPLTPNARRDILAELTYPPKPCPFYLLPKITKNPVKCRPVSNHREATSAPLSRWLHTTLETWTSAVQRTLRAQRIPIYILRDTLQLIHLLEAHNETHSPPGTDYGTHVVTHDHKSLYTHVTLQEITDGLTFLHTTLGVPCPIPLSYLLRAVSVVYTSNIIQPDMWDTDTNPVYIQHNGLAMGTPCAPSLCNLVLQAYEVRVYLIRRELRRPVPLLLARFIDDTVIIANDCHVKEIAEVAEHQTYEKHHTITMGEDKTPNHFLDLSLRTELNPKPPGTHRKHVVLHSNHPKPYDDSPITHYTSALSRRTFEGIVKGQVIRYLRNSSTKADFHRDLQRLTTHLKRRHYPASVIKRGQTDVTWEDRRKYLGRKTKKPNGINIQLPACIPERTSKRIRATLAQTWNMHSDTTNTPLRVTAEPTKNLGRQLTRHT